jgi:hypothetical protein
MKTLRRILISSLCTCTLIAAASAVQAQQVTGEWTAPQLTQEDITRLENAEAKALDGKPLDRVQRGPH